MTPRSIRRAQERKARKEQERKAENINLTAEELVLDPAADAPDFEAGVTEGGPISQAQLVANRNNAQLSSGPKSSEGKAKASLNAVKTGLTGRTILLPSDDAAEYRAHIQAFAAEYAPVGLREADLVQSIADSFWRMKRIPCLESALFAKGYLEFAAAFDEHEPSVRPGLIQAEAFLKYEKQLRNLQLQEARLFRRYEKDRAELLSLQETRQQREMEALQFAATRFKAARHSNQPFEPTVNGFEFSIEEIEQYLTATETRTAVCNASQSGSKTHSQAA